MSWEHELYNEVLKYCTAHVYFAQQNFFIYLAGRAHVDFTTKKGDKKGVG